MTETQGTIIRQIVSIIAYDSLRPVKLVTILLGIFAGIGFSFGPDPSEIRFLLTIMPLVTWTCLYLTLSVTRFIRMVTRIKNKFLIYAESSFGVWLWVMIFTSCMLSGEWGLNVLYIVPILMETWILGRSIYDYEMAEDLNRHRRKTDTEEKQTLRFRHE